MDKSSPADIRLVLIALALALGVIAFGREAISWLRGADPNFGRATFVWLVGSLIIAAAYRGYTRQHVPRAIPEWAEGAVSFVLLSIVFVTDGLVLRAPAAVVLPLALLGAAALTLAIMVRRSYYFLVVAPLISGLVGVLATPVLSIFFLESEINELDAFIFGAIVGGTAALPAWVMFRRAGPVGPRTMTIALLISALMVPWIVTTAMTR